ncbi:MAG: hydrogenase assembly protein HypC [Chloroflexi bacterium B3_Chlor]|nr:MAG: hydrogenase assembly protein HypC [Chloroflexi bacterium B3_Chlor]
MCVAVPLRVKSITDLRAEVEMGGVSRVVSLDLTPEAQVGDYVIVHAGYAIGILDEEEARETLEIFRQISDLMEADDEIP